MIKVSDLSFSYNSVDEALKHVNLEISKGSWVSILGHNGSGKSTLSKLLVGLLSPSGGEIHIDGMKLDEEHIAEIRKKSKPVVAITRIITAVIFTKTGVFIMSTLLLSGIIQLLKWCVMYSILFYSDNYFIALRFLA